MLDHNQGLRFDVYERIHLSDEVAAIDELEEIELTPHIEIVDQEEQVLLRGNLLLSGLYDSQQAGGTQLLEYWIPVEITLPMNRVHRLEDLAVDIDNFDVDLLSARTLSITGVLSLRGLIAEERPVYEQWEETEEPFTVVHRVDPEEERQAIPASESIPVAEGPARPYAPPESPIHGAAEQSARRTRQQPAAPPLEPTLPRQTPARTPEAKVSAVPEPVAEPARSVAPEEPAAKAAPIQPVPSIPEAVQAAPPVGPPKTAPLSVASPRQPKASAPPAAAAHRLDKPSAVTEPTAEPAAQQPFQTRSAEPLAAPQAAKTAEQADTEPVSWAGFAESDEREPTASPQLSEDTGPTEELSAAEPVEEEASPRPEMKIAFAGKRPEPGEPEDSIGLKSLLPNAQKAADIRQQAKPLEEEEAPEPQAASNAGDEVEWKRLFLSKSGEETEFRRIRMCIVQREETLEEIAERYQLGSREIILYNRLPDHSISEGQVLHIP
ncbi:hypothetical protein PA598K_02251 [Paenibacillus sp. 598K]|uniref:LysM peptidoglycan-binding domain-containing protein n=1 Tax=Paenibacillus sp. 598K TaxID=1117987 RepID=UPI000FF9851E|nr:LysM peptidoglycan-binding domain-containing protein [Paenibacillus sp. 598K]GBF73926.1 hypothetical protein PA598K_02251 [Paenibacillus sp. 598K]